MLNHPQVSAYHARLVQEQGAHRLTDLNSTNHTYVNGLQITSQLLQARDEIRIGPFRFSRVLSSIMDRTTIATWQYLVRNWAMFHKMISYTAI